MPNDRKLVLSIVNKLKTVLSTLAISINRTI
jgi:hypothetical protein